MHISHDPEAPNAKAWENVFLCGILTCDLKIKPFALKGFLLEGQISGIQTLECSRTLEPFSHAFQYPLKFVVEKDYQGDGWIVDDEDPDLLKIRLSQQVNEFDISECVRQEILLNEPMIPVGDQESDFSWNDPELTEDDSETDIPKFDARWQKLMELKNKKTLR